MTPAFSVDTTIARPAAQVWDRLTAWDQAHTWMKGVDSMAVDGPTVAGTGITFHARGKDRPSTIHSCDPGREIVLRSIQGGVTADYTYRLEPQGDDATRVTLVAACTLTGVLWGLAGPLLRFAMKQTDGGQLEDLKRVLEAEPA